MNEDVKPDHVVAGPPEDDEPEEPTPLVEPGDGIDLDDYDPAQDERGKSLQSHPSSYP